MSDVMESDVPYEERPQSEVAFLTPEEAARFDAETVRDALFFRGPWKDPVLDVPRHELFIETREVMGKVADQLTEKREHQAWSPAEILLTPDGAKRHAEMGGLWRQDPNDLRSPMEWMRDSVGEAGVFVPDPEQLAEEARYLSMTQLSALFIDGLTEDNLPNYSRIIAEVLRGSEEATVFLRQWLSDEDLHKLGFDLYMHFTQTLNPYLLEQQRSRLILEGEMPTNGDLFTIVAYTSIQEPATKYSHRQTPKNYYTPDGERHAITMRTMLGHIADHEDDHGEAYQEIGEVMMEKYPSQMVIALNRVVQDFNMPGSSIESFRQHAAILSWAGVFDVVDLYNIVVDVTSRFGVFDDSLKLHPEAEQAREELAMYMSAMRAKAEEIEVRRAEYRDSGKEDRKFRNPFSSSKDKGPVKVARRKQVSDLPFAA